eukprot:m.181180 g.181180  ORF g.181180 m.181180 type:complete len:147 (-) comp53463_c0_seq1:1149-1589(-)
MSRKDFACPGSVRAERDRGSPQIGRRPARERRRKAIELFYCKYDSVSYECVRLCALIKRFLTHTTRTTTNKQTSKPRKRPHNNRPDRLEKPFDTRFTGTQFTTARVTAREPDCWCASFPPDSLVEERLRIFCFEVSRKTPASARIR